MPHALPTNAAFKKTIETKLVRKALAFLAAKRSEYSQYRSLEDLVFAIPDPPTKPWSVLEQQLEIVLSSFRRSLYAHAVFIAGSVLDQILYDKIRNASITDPVDEALRTIRSVGIHKPGLILYPLHSISLLGVGLWEKVTKHKFEIFIEPGGLFIRSQTNSLKETIGFMERAAESMGIKRSVDQDDIEHYARSRPTKWLTNNPLLTVKARTFNNGYYENQRLLILHLERACSLIFMLASLQNGFPVLKNERLFGTGGTNNWQTQDIHHYILLEPRAGNSRRFETACIPMNSRAVELAELSNVNVDINLRAWARRQPIMLRICEALEAIEQGYLKYNILGDGTSTRGRFYRKIMQSLRYFRRSFRFTSGDDDLVSLTIAFEALLTDSYAPGVGSRLQRHAAALLKGNPRKTACVEEIGKIAIARNEVVHTSLRKEEVNLATVREAYTLCLLALIAKADALASKIPNPLELLILGVAAPQDTSPTELAG